MPEGFETWYLYREISGDNAWFNDEAYVDTLNPRAMDKFIEITHEAYYRSSAIPSATRFLRSLRMNRSSATSPPWALPRKKKVVLPYTDDFNETYKAAYGSDFFDTFPECIWELP
ncbi:MAG: hypothetical protein ACLR2E_13710 [Lachnospiraceae bacterium]